MVNDMNSGDIAAILRSLSEKDLIDNQSVFESIKHIDGVVRAVKFATEMDYESLYYFFTYKLEQAVDGMIEHVTPSCDAKLIFNHSYFIENHLVKLFEKYEGAACSCDKARTIIKSALRFYMTGRKIEFDYNAAYTYHLPETMLKDHENIVLFLKALVDLYYGNTDRYLSALVTVIPGMANIDEPST